jgi:NitT/TauT family transport system substrate-binding protein
MTIASKLSRRSVLVSGGGLAACAFGGLPSFAQGTPISIAVGSDPVFTPFYVAAHEKLFAAQGVDVLVKTYTDGGSAMDALVAQQVNMACASEPTHLVRLARAELRPLAVVQESGRYVKLVARKGLRVNQIKKFGFVPGSLSEYLTGLVIKKVGLDPATLQNVKSGPPELPALLARGDIDAYFCWEPWPSLGIRQGGEVLMTSEEVGYKTALWLTPVASWLDTNKAAAQSVLKALKQASELVQKDPQRAAVAVQAVTKIPTAQTLPLLKELDSVVRDFSDQDHRTTVAISEFLVQQKALSAPVDPTRFLQRGFFKG